MQASLGRHKHGLPFSFGGEFMVRYFELVLNLPRSASQTWLVQRHPGHHSWSQDELDAALLKAVAGLSRVANVTAEAGSSNPEPCSGTEAFTPCRDETGALAAAGLQMQIDTAPSGRRVTLVKRVSYSPAVSVCELLYEAPLETDAPLSKAFEAVPHALKQTLAEAGELAPLSAHAYMRECWQWQADDGITVEIALEQGAAGPTDSQAPLPREIRLTTPFVEDATAPALAALFRAANELIAALPAFPVLRAGRYDTGEDGDQGDHGDQPEANPARATPIDLTGLSTPHAALIAIGNNLAEHWFGNDAGVRDTISVEFVHQLRVSQRRLKTAMRIFPHWADEDWKTRIAPDLKWLGGVLGEARDWDVFVDTTLPALAAADADNERWTPTRERANLRRLEARERVQAAVASTRYAQLALAWLEWLSVLPSREPPAKGKDQSLHAYAKKRVRKYYKRLVSAPNLTTLDATARHKERIQAKYLRYTLEFFDSIASRKTRAKCTKTVSRLQSVLGDGNDVAVALGYLETLDVEPYQCGFARGWGEAAKRYTAQEGERVLRSLIKPKISRGGAE